MALSATNREFGIEFCLTNKSLTSAGAPSREDSKLFAANADTEGSVSMPCCQDFQDSEEPLEQSWLLRLFRPSLFNRSSSNEYKRSREEQSRRIIA